MKMQLYAALPYLELAHDKTITLGPVTVWPVTRSQAFISPEDHPYFQAYLSHMKSVDTCLSVDESVPLELRDQLVVDALHLLYFICSFRNIYYSSELPSIDAITHIARIDSQALKNHEYLQAPFYQTLESNMICLSCLETEMIEGLSKILAQAYLQTGSDFKFACRMISAIRYFVSCFFSRIVHFQTKEDLFLPQVFDSENCLLLAASFEALFDLQENNHIADFKQKLRPLLHLKYSAPLELFWKWCDGFFTLRQHLTRGEPTPTSFFTANSNFSVSYSHIGCLLFIYAVYYLLFTHELIQAEKVSHDFPPDFKWIHPEELLHFFWTEPYLLHKIQTLMIKFEENPSSQLKIELHFLIRLFITMRSHDIRKQKINGQFFKTPLKDLEKEADSILKSSSKDIFQSILTEEFLHTLTSIKK